VTSLDKLFKVKHRLKVSRGENSKVCDFFHLRMSAELQANSMCCFEIIQSTTKILKNQCSIVFLPFFTESFCKQKMGQVLLLWFR